MSKPARGGAALSPRTNGSQSRASASAARRLSPKAMRRSRSRTSCPSSSTRPAGTSIRWSRVGVSTARPSSSTVPERSAVSGLRGARLPATSNATRPSTPNPSGRSPNAAARPRATAPAAANAATGSAGSTTSNANRNGSPSSPPWRPSVDAPFREKVMVPPSPSSTLMPSSAAETPSSVTDPSRSGSVSVDPGPWTRRAMAAVPRTSGRAPGGRSASAPTDRIRSRGSKGRVSNRRSRRRASSSVRPVTVPDPSSARRWTARPRVSMRSTSAARSSSASWRTAIRRPWTGIASSPGASAAMESTAMVPFSWMRASSPAAREPDRPSSWW